jgi:hypothetical protein
MSVGPSDSRSDEASRDEHSDRAHALLPADIFSSTVQLGAPGRNRTCDSRFRKPLLYPLSYEGRKVAVGRHLGQPPA